MFSVLWDRKLDVNAELGGGWGVFLEESDRTVFISSPSRSRNPAEVGSVPCRQEAAVSLVTKLGSIPWSCSRPLCPHTETEGDKDQQEDHRRSASVLTFKLKLSRLTESKKKTFEMS